MKTPPRPLWLPQLSRALRVVADALDGGNSAVQAQQHPDKLMMGLTALVRVVGPVERIVAGRGDLADDAMLANSVMDAIAMAFPQTSAVIADIELAEPAFLWLAARMQAAHVAGGWSDPHADENPDNANGA